MSDQAGIDEILNMAGIPNTSDRNLSFIRGERPEPGTMFHPHEGFVPERAAKAIERNAILHFGHDDRLYRYCDGVYLPDGDLYVRVKVRELLGDRFRRRHADEVVAWFRAHEPTIGTPTPRHLINCQNGLLDWTLAELGQHNPKVLSTVQIPVQWNPDATCPRIERFLAEVLPDEATVTMVYELAGYCLLTEMPLHISVLLLGSGSNGKSTLLGLIRALLGPRNVSSVPLQAFAEDRFAAAQLQGKLANICGDLDARAVSRSDMFKMATGGDPVYAQRKHGQPFEFVNFALPLFSANEPPISSDQSDAWFRRWLIVPFSAKFTPDNADPALLTRLTARAELEGFLVRAAHGLLNLMSRGRFDIPDPVARAGARYRDRLDTVRTFVDEECVLRIDVRVTRPDLYRAYKQWATEGGRFALSNVTFYEHLTRNLDSQIQPYESDGKRGFKGIGLLTQDRP